MKMKKAGCVLLGGFFFSLAAMPVAGRESVNVNALIQETQQISDAPNEITMVWWLPEQFWEASLSQDPDITPAQIEDFLVIVRPYTIIAVVDGTIGPLGGVTYTSEEAIRHSVFIRDTRGRRHYPLRESEVSPDTSILLRMMKPMVTSMLGPMGENMHFLVFHSEGRDRRPIADPTDEGAFSVSIAGTEFVYRLPLGSLLPPKYDPRTGERFPGNYEYNPYTGDMLRSVTH